MSEAIVVEMPPGPDLSKFWWLPLVAGILTMLCGFVALVFPEPTIVVVGVLFGVYLALWGLVALIRGIGDPDTPVGVRILVILLGVLSILTGMVVMMRPDESVLALAWIMGFWWALTGVIHFVRGIAQAEDRGFNVFTGLVGIVGGIIILASPKIGVVTLLLIVGIGLLLQGAAEVAIGWRLRTLHKTGGATA